MFTIASLLIITGLIPYVMESLVNNNPVLRKAKISPYGFLMGLAIEWTKIIPHEMISEFIGKSAINAQSLFNTYSEKHIKSMHILISDYGKGVKNWKERNDAREIKIGLFLRVYWTIHGMLLTIEKKGKVKTDFARKILENKFKLGSLTNKGILNDATTKFNEHAEMARKITIGEIDKSELDAREVSWFNSLLKKYGKVEINHETLTVFVFRFYLNKEKRQAVSRVMSSFYSGNTYLNAMEFKTPIKEKPEKEKRVSRRERQKYDAKQEAEIKQLQFREIENKDGEKVKIMMLEDVKKFDEAINYMYSGIKGNFQNELEISLKKLHEAKNNVDKLEAIGIDPWEIGNVKMDAETIGKLRDNGFEKGDVYRLKFNYENAGIEFKEAVIRFACIVVNSVLSKLIDPQKNSRKDRGIRKTTKDGKAELFVDCNGYNERIVSFKNELYWYIDNVQAIDFAIMIDDEKRIKARLENRRFEDVADLIEHCIESVFEWTQRVENSGLKIGTGLFQYQFTESTGKRILGSINELNRRESTATVYQFIFRSLRQYIEDNKAPMKVPGATPSTFISWELAIEQKMDYLEKAILEVKQDEVLSAMDAAKHEIILTAELEELKKKKAEYIEDFRKSFVKLPAKAISKTCRSIYLFFSDVATLESYEEKAEYLLKELAKDERYKKVKRVCAMRLEGFDVAEIARQMDEPKTNIYNYMNTIQICFCRLYNVPVYMQKRILKAIEEDKKKAGVKFSVVQGDPHTGETINIFDSAYEAAQAIGKPKLAGAIRRCCEGKDGRKSAGGFAWKYETVKKTGNGYTIKPVKVTVSEYVPDPDYMKKLQANKNKGTAFYYSMKEKQIYYSDTFDISVLYEKAIKNRSECNYIYHTFTKQFKKGFVNNIRKVLKVCKNGNFYVLEKEINEYVNVIAQQRYNENRKRGLTTSICYDIYLDDMQIIRYFLLRTIQNIENKMKEENKAVHVLSESDRKYNMDNFLATMRKFREEKTEIKINTYTNTADIGLWLFWLIGLYGFDVTMDLINKGIIYSDNGKLIMENLGLQIEKMDNGNIMATRFSDGQTKEISGENILNELKIFAEK